MALSILGTVERWFHNHFGVQRRHVHSTRIYEHSSELAVAEKLEGKELLTAVNSTPQEQLLLELVNRARADPQAEANRYGIGLNDGVSTPITTAAKQPLAPNQILLNVSRAHSDDMLLFDYFNHTDRQGGAPWDRATAAGYQYSTIGENISWGGSTGPIDQNAHVYERHRRLFLSSGHRENIMGEDFRELGSAVRYGQYTHTDGNTYNASMVTEMFGARGQSISFLTGVVYTDASDGGTFDDDFYSIGESAGGGTVTAVNVSSGATFTDQIGAAGGYFLELPAGTYTVTVTGGGLGSTTYIANNVQIGSRNVKVDFETTTATMFNPSPQPEDSVVFTGFVNGNLWTSQSVNGSWETALAARLNTTSIRQIVKGDFNGDNIEDVAVWAQNGDWHVGISNGQGQFNDSVWTTWRTTGIKEIRVGDFNNDGRDDLIGLFEAGGRGKWWVAESNGNRFVSRFQGTFHSYQDVQVTQVGDFNNDNVDDLVVQTANGSWWIAKNLSGSLQFEKWTQWNVSNGLSHVQTGDFNNDGRLDIAGLIGNGTQRLWWVGLSNGLRFINRNWTQWTVTQSLDAVLTGDFNGDGATDIAGLFNGQHWWVSLASSNRFATSKWDQWSFASGGLRQVDAVDVDGDGKTDLVGWDQDGWWNIGRATGNQFATERVVRWSPTAPWQGAVAGSFTSNPTLSLLAEEFAEPSLADILNRIDWSEFSAAG